jgi:hypothetical protein
VVDGLGQSFYFDSDPTGVVDVMPGSGQFVDLQNGFFVTFAGTAVALPPANFQPHGSIPAPLTLGLIALPLSIGLLKTRKR